MADFLPRADSALLSWSSNFDRQVNSDPQPLGLSSQQAMQYSNLHNAMADAMTLAIQPETRTAGTINAKDQSVAALKSYARMLAAIVRSHLQVGDDQLLNLGLRVRRRSPRRLQRPDHPPTIQVIGWTGRTAILRLGDARSPAHAAKPRDVRAATILMCVGENPAADRANWSIARQVSRTFVRIEFPASLKPGTKIWLTANWFNSRGHGPNATPVFTHAGYGVSKVAA